MKKHSILIVDDSRTTRKYLKSVLKQANYTVQIAADGREGLHLLKEQHFDVILCDMQMPEIDGLALRRKLLTHPKYSAIPFVAMSTFDCKDNYRIMLELKAAAFLKKPFKPEHLFVLLDRLLADTDFVKHTQENLAKTERKMMLNSIMSLAKALDARDKYTRSHSDSVSKLAVKLARHMGIAIPLVGQLHIASRMHDLGKIGIPDSILLKPDKLSEDEFVIIKSHPEVGARILQSIPSLREVAEIIHCHHERPDGQGYPRGLKTGEIHPLAHILSIADTYDALISDRPYRQGHGKDVALEILVAGRGNQFHAECLDAFIEMIRQENGFRR